MGEGEGDILERKRGEGGKRHSVPLVHTTRSGTAATKDANHHVDSAHLLDLRSLSLVN